MGCPYSKPNEEGVGGPTGIVRPRCVAHEMLKCVVQFQRFSARALPAVQSVVRELVVRFLVERSFMSTRSTLDVRPLQVFGFRPVHPEDTGLDVNPGSSYSHAEAIRSIMLYILADAFDLHTEETIWAGHAFDAVCGELVVHNPHSVPLAARQEMLNGTYTRQLELRENAHLLRGSTVYDRAVMTASREEWAEILLALVTSSYTLPPLTEARLLTIITTVLTELGVGSKQNPRGATHLPTDLRLRLFSSRQYAETRV